MFGLKNKYREYRHIRSVNNKIIWLDNYWAAKMSNHTKLSKEQINAVDSLYKKYIPSKVHFDYVAHAFYLEKTGVFDPLFIPDSIHFILIDQFLNNWKKAKYIDNKCHYPIMFYDIKQPTMLGYRLNGLWYDGANKISGIKSVTDVVMNTGECFIKKATDSYGGKGVYYFNSKDNTKEDFIKIIDAISSDLVIQEGLKQSPVLAKLNKSSVNTVRLISMLHKDGTIKIYSSIVRMGVDGSKVDNATSGGITCGIMPSGKLKPVAYNAKGVRFLEHPTSHQHFEEVIIPQFDEIKKKIIMLHPRFPDFRLISWDIALDETDSPVLIEANLCDGEIDFHQLNNGPLFKEDTELILSEVFLSQKAIV